eukprot:scaffold341_cov368-Pavlova_lutheri.AAC.12
MFGHVPWVVVSVHRATHSLPEPLGKRRAGIIVLGEANAAEESVVGLETTSYQGSASGSGQKSAQYRSVPKFSKIAAGPTKRLGQSRVLVGPHPAQPGVLAHSDRAGAVPNAAFQPTKWGRT